MRRLHRNPDLGGPDLLPVSGVLAIVLATAAMALEQGFAGWLTLRALAGFASAWVMVHASAWLLERLTQAHREDLSGVVYAGVGAGIVLAGLVCVALAALEQDSRTAWIALALVALAIVACTWPVAGDAKPLQASAGRVRNGARACPHFRHLVLCYGAFGLGYIIPATFLPVMAKELVAAPGLFEWAWPVFGAAAALSTLAAARLRRAMTGRTLWIGGNLVMAAGVLVPLVLPNLIGIVLAALCVGGTFMVVTMAGLQEARSVAGSNARADASGAFLAPEPAPFVNTAAEERDPWLSADGSRLFFASDREGSIDIFELKLSR